MSTEPQPLSMTASGGNKIAKMALRSDIVIYMFLVVKIQHYRSLYKVFALYVVDVGYIRGWKQKSVCPSKEQTPYLGLSIY